MTERRKTVWWFAIVTSMAFVGLFAACDRDAGTTAPPAGAAQAQMKSAGGVEPRQVCFMNNKYMGKPQIPVEIDGKTYYGCCAGCAAALRNDPSTRVATDPYSGAKVDKATAFIARNPADPDSVLYFESATTFAAYSQARH